MAGFLKMGDVKGAAEDSEHKEWIELLSVGQVVQRPMSSGSGGANNTAQSATKLHDIQITKKVDKATPLLFEAIVDGKRFPEVEIHLCTSQGASGRKPYYKIKLKNVVVSDLSFNATADPGMGDTESLALNFTEIEWCYTSFKPDGAAAGDTKATFKVGPGTK